MSAFFLAVGAVVGEKRFERSTSWSQTRRSAKLSYTPMQETLGLPASRVVYATPASRLILASARRVGFPYSACQRSRCNRRLCEGFQCKRSPARVLRNLVPPGRIELPFMG